MDKRDYGLIFLAVAVCAVVLVGEYATYGNVYRYEASADATGNFSVYDSGSHSYTAVLSDNGTFQVPTKFYIYYDEGYGSVVHDAKVEVGAKALDQKYYLSQLVNNLRYYSVTDVTYVNAAELESKMSEPGAGVGLIMISGAIPETVYTGAAGCPILNWIASGGSLYWAGESIGKYIGKSDGTTVEVAGYEALFLGTGTLNSDTGDTRALTDVSANTYRRDLSLKNNDVRYAVNVSSVTDALAVGYEKDGCASSVLVKNGAGMVCVMGGNYSNNQRMDMANIIASGICYCSSELDCKTGTVSRGTVNGTFDNWPGTGHNVAVFLYLGGDFSVYGKLFAMTL